MKRGHVSRIETQVHDFLDEHGMTHNNKYDTDGNHEWFFYHNLDKIESLINYVIDNDETPSWKTFKRL